MKSLPVCIIGSVAYDNLMRYPNKFHDQLQVGEQTKIDTCFVCDQRTIQYGGTAANLAIGFKKLGIDSLMLSKVGEDIDDYCRELKSLGITTDGLEIVPKENTLAVFIITDENENQITFIHPGAFTYMKDLSLKDHHLIERKVKLVFINPLLGFASRSIAEQCLALSIPYVFDPGQNISTISKQDLLWCARNANYFIVNEAEYRLFKSISQLTDENAQTISDMVIVTHGRNGSSLYHQGESFEIPIVKPTSLVDPTGAGDAYRAGFFSGVLNNLPLRTCGKMGALAGTYCVEETGAQNPTYTYEEFRRRFEGIWEDPLPQ